MLTIVVMWLYIFIISISIGMFILNRIGRDIELKISKAFMAGTIAVTVYAQIFSQFYKIGALAHVLMLIFAIACLIIERKNIISLYKKSIKEFNLWKILVFIGIILACAFFTSRGEEHGDTLLYHSQFIHWLEEYGTLKGLGNVKNNYAYNSASLFYAALFSMKFMTGVSLHTTNGIIMTFCSIYAICGLWNWKKHSNHVADAARAAIIFYDIVICVVIMSPATDQPANFMAIYIVLRWLENTFEENKSIDTYALICVTGVYALTLKLSAGIITLLVIYPLVLLIEKKEIKKILLYLSLGLLVCIPFFVNNVRLSGWILYPFPSLDLFNVSWKIPVEKVIIDANYISTYGKRLYDPNLADMAFKDWFKIWWETSETYERYLLVAQAGAIFLIVVTFIKQVIKKEKIRWEVEILNVVLIVCILFWLFKAPFIRYSLGFLLVTPLVATGQIKATREDSLYNVITTLVGLAVLTCMMPYWTHYISDAMVCAKHHLNDNYWIQQQDYEVTEYEEIEVDGVTFYTSPQSTLSYYSFPGAADGNFKLIGKDIKDGFEYRDASEN